MSKILLVEDNHDLAESLINNLVLEGYRVHHVERGNEAAPAVVEQRPDLVVLDLMLPNKDGFAILAELRERGCPVPVLCLTARGAELDKVRALRIGADDYVTKPFGLMELLARIGALLRRSERNADDAIRFGELEIRPDQRTVSVAGRGVELAPKEYDLLLALARRPNRVYTRQQLMREVWGHAGTIVSRTVDTHVATLRAKLEPDPARPRYVVTCRKAGYKLNAPSR